MKKTLSTILLLALSVTTARAGEIGHYAGGVYNLRDYFVPADAGFYGALYNYYYQTGRVNDANGNEVKSVTIGKGPSLTLDIDPDVDVYYMIPTLIWVTPYKVLGADVAVFVSPTFANSSVGASISTERGRGIDPDDSQFGLGDWYFQPLWLGWHLEHFDFSLAWGFYAPTGKYDTKVLNLPVVGPKRVDAADNIGLGFWTNQFQGAVAWYPWVSKGTALTLTSTYEVNSEKKEYHLTPGQNLSLNWGVSQYLPLTKDQKWLAEVGPAGYDTWEVTSDKGQNAANGVKDQVHAVGAQVGLTSVEYLGVVNFHYYYEYASQDRFQGHVIGLSLVKHF